MSDYQQIQLRNRFNMTFTNGSSTEIARMDELDDGSLTFTGNMDEAAKIFFEQIVKYNSLEIQTLEAKIKELEAERDTEKEWNRQLVNILTKYTSREISGGDIDYPEDVAELLVRMQSNPKALKEMSDER